VNAFSKSRLPVRYPLDLAFLFSALLALSACGEAVTLEDQGGASGTAGAGGGGDTGGRGIGGSAGSENTGGAGGVSYLVCTLGLCMEDEALARSCQEVYDVCVGQGHYTRCCRMDADKTCGVFGETGPY